MSEEQQARQRKWKGDEVIAFAQYFRESQPNDFAEFLRQQHEFNEIEPGLALLVRQLISKWIPNLDSSDRRGLFRKFRRYARSQLAAQREIE
ncbi:hypothetical protein [Lysobacter enzymogenes]|uniref:hypothetical protein n=1 Tax=Lysobacter enzymogenes TaxID=69 RepID=UPI001113E6F3|nr:hypothetical protein [Lysobacter enzymogenes]